MCAIRHFYLCVCIWLCVCVCVYLWLNIHSGYNIISPPCPAEPALSGIGALTHTHTAVRMAWMGIASPSHAQPSKESFYVEQTLELFFRCPPAWALLCSPAWKPFASFTFFTLVFLFHLENIIIPQQESSIITAFLTFASLWLNKWSCSAAIISCVNVPQL